MFEMNKTKRSNKDCLVLAVYTYMYKQYRPCTPDKMSVIKFYITLRQNCGSVLLLFIIINLFIVNLNVKYVNSNYMN